MKNRCFYLLTVCLIITAIFSCKKKEETVTPADPLPPCQITVAAFSLFTYNSSGSVSDFTSPVPTANGIILAYSTVTYIQNKISGLSIYANKNNTGTPLAVSTVTLTDRNRINSVVNKDNSGSVTFEYNDKNQVTRITLKDGSYSRLEYNAQGNVTSHYVKPAGSQPEQLQTQYTTYDDKSGTFVGNANTYMIATSQSLLLDPEASIDSSVLSENNPTASVLYKDGKVIGSGMNTYTYNSKGYPVTVVEKISTTTFSTTFSSEYAYQCR